MAFAGVVGGLQVVYSAKNQFACYVTNETEARLTQIGNEFDLKKKSALVKKFGDICATRPRLCLWHSSVNLTARAKK